MTAEIALISPLEVKKHLNDDAPYLIVDARPHSHYVAGHLPGAVWIGWEDWCEEAPACAGQAVAQAGYWGVLNEGTAGSLQEPLRQLGLRDELPVLVYADGPLSKGREGRVAWMLLYWGFSSVLLLNGGWSAWLKHGGSWNMATPTLRCGQFHMRIQEHRRVRLHQLRQAFHRNSLPLLIDVRSRAEFAGHRYAYQPRLGRLVLAIWDIRS